MPGLEPRAPRFVFCGSNSQRAARGKGRAETLNTRCTYSSTAHIKVVKQHARGEKHRPLERTKLWISADRQRPRPESGVGALVWRSRLKDLLRQSSGPRFGHEAVDKQRGPPPIVQPGSSRCAGHIRKRRPPPHSARDTSTARPGSARTLRRNNPRFCKANSTACAREKHRPLGRTKLWISADRHGRAPNQALGRWFGVPA